MCGICGIFEYSTGAAVPRELIQRMNDTLVHRGPDDEGMYVEGPVGIANRRLSIIDVAGSKQPISNEDGTVWVVLNGEIYNFRALQRHLRDRGHTLRTDGDTECIVHLYEEYGDDCVHHLDGMFAFAVFDNRPAHGGPRLLVGRDRLGKKPLYYADVQGALVFGSEAKAVLRDPRITRALDPQALHHYLTLFVVPAPYSIYRSVRKLMPGHVLTADRAGVRTRRYWNYFNHLREAALPEEEVVAEIRRRLFAAVEKRLVAEVPLGAFLSGGLDSSAVVAVMSRLMREPVNTFSVGFEGTSTHNELPAAAATARHLGTRHHEFMLKHDIVEQLPDLLHATDEPFAISSAIPTLLMSRAARKEITVVLTGDGGDEVFGGYESNLFERWARMYRILPRSVDQLLRWSAERVDAHVDTWEGRLRSRALRFVGNARRNDVARRLGWNLVLDERDKSKLYSRAMPPGLLSTESFLESHLDGLPNGIPTERIGNVLDTLVWLPDEMLTKVDRMTMAASIEARCPLLDLDLVEYLAGVPQRQQVPGMRPTSLKHLLRRAVSDLLPFDRMAFRKWGFNVPLSDWFRTGAKGWLLDRLSHERLRRRGVFDADEVHALIQRHLAGEINVPNVLFALVVFETWAEMSL